LVKGVLAKNQVEDSQLVYSFQTHLAEVETFYKAIDRILKK
jgi:hypothetical protein